MREVIVTTCPLCEMNVEAYQGMVNKAYGTNFKIPVMYFTQLVGYRAGHRKQGPGSRQAGRVVEPVLAAIPA